MSLQLEDKSRKYVEIKDFIESERSITQEMIDDLERELTEATARVTSLDAACRAKEAERAEQEALATGLREQLQQSQAELESRAEELRAATEAAGQAGSSGAEVERLCGELVEQELTVCELQQRVEDLEREAAGHAEAAAEHARRSKELCKVKEYITEYKKRSVQKVSPAPHRRRRTPSHKPRRCGARGCKPPPRRPPPHPRPCSLGDPRRLPFCRPTWTRPSRRCKRWTRS